MSTRLSGDICRGFTTELLTLLSAVFAESAAPRPDDAAQICLAVLVGLIAADRTELLRPAVDAAVSGLGVPAGVELAATSPVRSRVRG